MNETNEESDPKNNLFCGLMQRQARTQDHILEGFWMQGHFVVFLTTDDAKYIYLEVFDFDNDDVKSICERVFLCDSNRFDRIEIKLNATREFIAVMLYTLVRSPSP